ncbi:MAG: YciI family protein [Tepidiformaceae bacterium]
MAQSKSAPSGTSKPAMRYMMLIYTNETQDAPLGTPEWDALMGEYRAFGAEARRRKALVAGAPLQSVETATTLRFQGGRLVTSDGPFAETREQLGGYYILECRDQAEAIELAAMIPSAKKGSIEVRPMAGHDTRVLQAPKRKHYIALIYGQESKYLPADDPRLAQSFAQHQSLTLRTTESGEFIAGDGLALTRDAVTVRIRNGKAINTDGPFAETKEQLGGFYIFNCDDLDRALALASDIPAGDYGCVEVRPLEEV